jgi:hypothetical protein
MLTYADVCQRMQECTRHVTTVHLLKSGAWVPPPSFLALLVQSTNTDATLLGAPLGAGAPRERGAGRRGGVGWSRWRRQRVRGCVQVRIR